MTLTKEQQAFKDEVDVYLYEVREAIREAKALTKRWSDVERRFNKIEKELRELVALRETKD